MTDQIKWMGKTDRDVLARINDGEHVLCAGRRRVTTAIKLVNAGVAKITRRISWNAFIIAKA